MNIELMLFLNNVYMVLAILDLDFKHSVFITGFIFNQITIGNVRFRFNNARLGFLIQ